MSTVQHPRPRGAEPRGGGRRAAFFWTVLVVAGLLEIVWSLALKEAEGLTRPGWAAAGIATAMASLGLLSYALKGLPVGSAYAAWVGIGSVGVAVAGMLALGEPVTVPRLLFLGLIVAGVVILSLAETPPGEDGAAERPGAANAAEQS
ncbi:multidrug efflux SMR transporter [Nocardiopsis sp. RSe5-2]|uniref:Multidrug efflux SMR transporter n=1 Tax=Nocardiopsis endophytica TaxID=3018445 RepID=A0ABT4U378_9ACTN|nr:multidrug efflux SMR transporter [Nocardiopsis endophytica]MDA2811417.1 multidrug efflux SMR transporter [Nocardiopsis endophytica]